MNVALVALNSSFIHKNLAVRWLYVARPKGQECRIFEYTVNDDLNRLLKQLVEYQPKVIGISVYIWNTDYLKVWLWKLREALPQSRIVLGGPDATYDPMRWFDYPIDAVLRGEGEETFWQYALQTKDEIDGLITRTYCSKVEYARASIDWIETLESPYFLEMDQKNMRNQYLYVETSRGCPYHCSYCLASVDNQVRLFSDDYLANLFDQLQQSEVRQVKFLDRTFNVKPKRALWIAKRLSAMPEQMSFQFEVVAETLSKELLDFFLQQTNKKRFRFEIGLQTFHEQSLQSVLRKQNNDTLVKVIEQMRDHQCIMHVDLIAGLPYEDYASFKKTFQRLFDLRIDEMQVGILKLLRGTRLMEQLEEFGIEYQSATPYTIEKNLWMTHDQLAETEVMAFAVDKYWNSGKCRYTLDWLDRHLDSGYDLFLEIGKRAKMLPRPYQPHEMFQIILDLYESQFPELRAVLMMDWYRLFKQRPKRWLPSLEETVRDAIVAFMIDQGFSEEIIHRYAMLDLGYDGENVVYQCVIYNKQQTYPQRYLVDMEQRTIRKEEK